MKSKSGNVIIHIIYIILVVIGIKYIRNCDFEKADIVTLNKSYMEVQEKLTGAITNHVDLDIQSLEEQYECNILMLDNKNYKQEMYHAIKNGYVVFDLFKEDVICGKVIFRGRSADFTKMKQLISVTVLIVAFALLAVYDISVVMLYYNYIRPFKKLEAFAGEVAKGNLDAPLKMNRHNYFGVFTESFDVMREELKHARQKEYEANQSKKELVASLSHDMKTPIATIQASCEVLMIKMKENENIDKIKLIQDRAEMIDSLISNMFHATLEELEVLDIDVKEEPSNVVADIIEKARGLGDVRILSTCPECLVYLDTLRFSQVIDNIINNSKKYAQTQIDIAFQDVSNGIIIKIRDYGPGVSEESLPLLTEKFYRANNSKGNTGAGLGMYLANYFMKKMNGAMEYYNEDGFVVELFVKKV
jgi:signal transduction histidine kinase